MVCQSWSEQGKLGKVDIWQPKWKGEEEILLFYYIIITYYLWSSVLTELSKTTLQHFGFWIQLNFTGKYSFHI